MRLMLLPLLLLPLGISHASHEDDTDLPHWAVDKITPMHDRVTNWLDNNARNIDNFFGTDDSLTMENGSYMRFSQEFSWHERDRYDWDTALRVKLDLPTTKERLRILIESDPEETQGTLAEQGANTARSNNNFRTEDFLLGLRRLSDRDKREHWRFDAGAGIKVKLPLDPYVRFTGERQWQLNDGPWVLDSWSRASWFNEEGYSVRSRWDLGRPLSDIYHLRFITNVQWQEEVDTLEYSEGIELNQLLGTRSAIRYAAVAVGRSASDPRLYDYYLLSQYRRNLHREILFVDFIPEVHFPREQNYDAEFGVTLRFELLFRADLSWGR
ncbi:hypothetical protein Q9290_12415 [Oceanimonas sp. CHS3-5]|uniref:hypothetical protein n=1 Tax=Oceanimonas sp. CHS3-5 TaxID=3068186 RepID=UPI00273EEEF0|nr:hypothetical protein [Oceanimonas sp. CHS3-5]MDP5293082.1 hypothetical protein [Oceanimonas sp. CHS3-5]